MMDEAELAAIEARARAATGGVWEASNHCSSIYAEADGSFIAEAPHEETQAFIAHAGGDNGDVLRLVAEVRRLRAENAVLKQGHLPGCHQQDGEPVAPCAEMLEASVCAGCVRLSAENRAELEGRG